MQRIVATHVGVTNRGLQDVKQEITGQTKLFQNFANLFSENFGNVFSNWMEAVKQINDRLERVENTVKQQMDQIDEDIIPRIKKLESQWRSGEGERLTSTKATPDSMQYIHEISRILNLVTAKEFSVGRANRSLDNNRKRPSYTECVDKITNDDLKEEFISAFAPFDKGDDGERSERLLLIQRLNKDLLKYFTPRVAD